MYNLENVYTRLSQSNLRVGLDIWGAMNLAPELAARARVPNNVDNDLRAAHGGVWATILAENEAAGWTSPGVAAANAPGALFVLSISEVNRYAAAVGTTNAERRAYDHLYSWSRRDWLLRSPGTNALHPVTQVSSGGALNNANTGVVSSGIGARPALWINL